MRIALRLPIERAEEGYGFLVNDDGTVREGPFRCLGKSDNAAAAAHGNFDPAATPDPRDDRKPYGDFPYGVYRVVRVDRFAPPHPSFGSCFLALDPIEGNAWRGETAGRTGLGMHPGPLLPGERLRPTFGCCRITEPCAALLAPLIEAELAAGRPVLAECAPPWKL